MGQIKNQQRDGRGASPQQKMQKSNQQRYAATGGGAALLELPALLAASVGLLLVAASVAFVPLLLGTLAAGPAAKLGTTASKKSMSCAAINLCCAVLGCP